MDPGIFVLFEISVYLLSLLCLATLVPLLRSIPAFLYASLSVDLSIESLG